MHGGRLVGRAVSILILVRVRSSVVPVFVGERVLRTDTPRPRSIPPFPTRGRARVRGKGGLRQQEINTTREKAGRRVRTPGCSERNPTITLTITPRLCLPVESRSFTLARSSCASTARRQGSRPRSARPMVSSPPRSAAARRRLSAGSHHTRAAAPHAPG